ncbi:MAG: hypothetical protein M1833_000560 [Piccolia ochrophora]|nr:MAG: hypothetical protein M1833_000560 [Piccolia ochrophora]
MSTSSFKSSVAAGFHRPAHSRAPAPVSASSAPAGTFATGTKVQVGTHRVVIERYLSEGGFAHVYLVKLPQRVGDADVAVLKRVAVPDKEALANMRTEVETMKKLRGQRPIVTYLDSHASQLKGGGYEVFLLMEYCAGGGLIDFMNTRLQHRLTEPEILKIFSDVAEGVACMHYLKPPLLHRDLKVENVLISATGTSRRYKLCDFGSTAPPRPAATSAQECRLIEEDVQKHTTLQYRSPEMIDVYRKQPIDEKSDIWALGVLLYKLCYYTTPFEEQGQLAILNASFKYPAYPPFSDRVKKLIASMLQEKPNLRPNVYLVLREACAMQGLEVPIKDIYAGRTASEARRSQKLPSPEPTVSSPPMVGAFQAPPTQPQQVIPDIVPMRRGRPTSSSQHQLTTKPSASPLRGVSGDPFAALDAKSAPPDTDNAQDELSLRFPTLDQFSILHESGGNFEFDPASPSTKQPRDLSKRVTDHLADEAFVRSPALPATDTIPMIAKKPKAATDQVVPSAKPTSIQSPPFSTTSTKPAMVSQGTMTSPDPAMQIHSRQRSSGDYAMSAHARSSSQPRSMAPETSRAVPPSSTLGANLRHNKRPALLDVHRSKSQTDILPKGPRRADAAIGPSSLNIESPISRSRSVNVKPRPASTHLESNLDYLRERDSSPGISDSHPGTPPLHGEASNVPTALTESSDRNKDETNIASNVEFLRTMEEDDGVKRKEKRSSSGSKPKRSSMPSISLSNTKTLLAGRFGDAFRRFEGGNAETAARTPSPMDEQASSTLTPIAGSVATGERSDDDTEEIEMAPEVKRELERHRLVQEEQRVEAAAAEYRKKLADRDSTDGRPRSAGAARAASIQHKVKSLLHENTEPVPSQGARPYGSVTEPIPGERAQPSDSHHTHRPFAQASTSGPSQPHTPRTIGDRPSGRALISRKPVVQEGSSTPSQQTAPRPSAPPKPTKLRTGGKIDGRSGSPPKPASLAGQPLRPRLGASPTVDDWEANFTKRYPSLSKLEMVETEIDKTQPVNLRSKDV